jgi:NTE family protein
VELDTGRRVAFGQPGAPRATMSDAVRASCAVPAYFEPIRIGASRYVDGGVHSSTNADLVAGERFDLVLLSAPMSAARGAVQLAPDMAMRHIAQLSVAREVAALRRRDLSVVVFQPTAADLEVMTGDPLDPAKAPPVCTRVLETTSRRLGRADVRAQLAALVN